MDDEFFDEDVDMGLDDGGDGGIGDDDDDEDAQLKPMEASGLTHTELMAEMETRGLHTSGFFAKKLQVQYDNEHHKFIEERKKGAAERRERKRKLAGLQRKRQLLERQLREEQEAVAEDDQIATWLDSVRSDSTAASARIDVTSITCRALAKSMWNNASLTVLDCARCKLDDLAGAALARMLKRNTALRKLELDMNALGPRAAEAFGDSLRTNKSLQHLSLEANPLTRGGADCRGSHSMAAMLSINKALTSLNLWRCGMGGEAGMEFARQFAGNNDTLVFLDVGNNGFLPSDVSKIAEKLGENKARFAVRRGLARAQRDESNRKAADEAAVKAEDDKRTGVLTWIEEQKVKRTEERMAAMQALREERIAQEAAAAADAEAERLRKEAEAAAGSKKKKKGKKGKK